MSKIHFPCEAKKTMVPPKKAEFENLHFCRSFSLRKVSKRSFDTQLNPMLVKKMQDYAFLTLTTIAPIHNQERELNTRQ